MDPVRILNHIFAELSIQDAIRKSTSMAFPDESLLVQFNLVAADVMNKLSGSFESHRSDIISFFGAPMIVVAKLWQLILANNDWNEKLISNKEHLLWALHYMKENPNFTVLCKTMMKNGRKCPAKKTVIKWVWFYGHCLGTT